MESTSNPTGNHNHLDIAIVGMAGRFPGANDLNEFWDNLKHGVESIRFYDEDEVIASGIFPDMARDPDFVPAAGGLDHEYDFDAEFFDFNPREAEITDPQQRITLECAWEALEAAGYNPDTYPGRIGVYAGISINTYLLFNLAANHKLLDTVGLFPVMTANDKDFLTTRVSYKLNLKGPSMSVQTACSTSLVALNLACQSLLNYQTDMVLAGGVSITPKGRLYKEGFIFSKDGHCRTFDAEAQGTVGGNGVGLVLIKRLEDAIADGDHIHAIIKGSAINNDGAMKVGYTAPSVDGQVDVILEAQAVSDIHPDTITYIEAHGTGTLLGDPIEISALTQAFRTQTERKQYCAIGSVKTNIGHLDTAAGISGFIKAVLAVENAQIPPSLNYHKPNPKLDIDNTPFFVNTALRDWTTDGIPRRAGISSFGFGGTNAHTIIEQAPAREPSPPSRDAQVLLVSGRNEAALKANAARLAAHLQAHPEANLADIAYTLQAGRKAFKHRAALVARDPQAAAAALETFDLKQLIQGSPRDAEPSVVFMFSGQGSQYVGMARGLHDSEPAFRRALQEVADAMQPELGIDLLTLLFGDEAGDAVQAAQRLAQTRYTQPALFAVEYALARLWQSWGVQPKAMIGHSIGEYVAATLAGVFSLADAARLVCLRGRLVQEQPGGSMLSVPLDEQRVLPLLTPRLSLAAVNAPGLCVVAGDDEAVEALRQQLAARGIEASKLIVSHAFHSHMLEQAAREFERTLADVALQAPTLPYVSNVSGTWITAEQATSPAYWADHLRKTVRFSDGLLTLLKDKPSVLLEVGPGQVLTTLARPHRDHLQGAALVSSTRHPLVEGSDVEVALKAVGQLWLAGVALDWTAFHHHGVRRRVPLPTYAFQRKRYWIAPPVFSRAGGAETVISEEVQEAVAEVHAFSDLGNYVAPRDDLERIVGELWERLLGIGRIGVHDDFFKLGGHSLLATQLIAEVRKATDSEVSVQALFKDPTIAGLASEIRSARQANPNYQVTVIPRIDRQPGVKLPLSFHQQMVWDFERRWPGTARFNGMMTLKLTGPLDLEALQFAMDEMLRRHEVLRTNFRHDQGVSEAIVHPARHLPVPFKDLSALAPAKREQHLTELANTMVREPFDLTQDLYLRPVLVKMAEQEHALIIASHYVAVDGWTIGLVVQEFGAHYTAYQTPGAKRLPELSFQAVDYAAWQREKVSDASVEHHVAYWREQLKDIAPQNPVPGDRLRPLRPTMRGSTYYFSLGQGLTDRLRDFCAERGYTTFMTLTAALDVLYHAYSGMNDIVIGTMTGDRDIGTEAMIGSLVNLLALRTKVDAGQSFLDVLESVRKTATDAYAHPVPFALLVDKLHRNVMRNPLFRTVFILRNVPYTETQAGKVAVELTRLPINRQVADCDLTLYLQEKKGVLSGYFEYSTDLFNRSTIEELASHFVGLLGDLLSHPEAALSGVMPTPAARPVESNRMQRLLSMLGRGEAA